MREIKFRAWAGGVMVYFDLFNITKTSGHIDDNQHFRRTNSPQLSVSDICPIMQFTGLKDNTKWEQLSRDEQELWLSIGKTKEEWIGKEIYEGDIVEDTEYIGDIRFKNGAFCVWFVNIPKGWNHEYFPVFMGMDNAKVIGNIYENSELLTSDKEVV